MLLGALHDLLSWLKKFRLLRGLGRLSKRRALGTLGMIMFLREELGRYFRETTIHGLSYIATQRNMLVKLFWVLVMIGGFVCTYFLCALTLSDWEENPYVTNVESRPIPEIQFPTVTICRDQQQKPDKWALVSTLANNVKFECYDRQGYPNCSEAQAAREHPTVKKMLDLAFDGIVKNLHRVPLENKFEEYHRPEVLSGLQNVTLEMAAAAARDKFGRKLNWDEILPRCDTCKGFCSNEAQNEECLSRIQHDLRLLKATHPVYEPSFPFGTLLALFFEELEADSSWSYSCPSITIEEEAIQPYLRSLSLSVGLGNVSLHEVPLIFGLRELDWWTHDFFFVKFTYCANEDIVNRLYRLWFEFVTEGNGHPCDRGENCNRFANLVLASGTLPLSNLLRVMKVAHHIGIWSSNQTFVETEEFPTYHRPMCFEKEYSRLFGQGPSDDIHNAATERIVTTGKIKKHDTRFQPVISDYGFCLATNSEPMTKLISDDSPFKETFATAFHEDIVTDTEVQKNLGSGEHYSLSFMANLQLPYTEIIRDDSDTSHHVLVAINWEKNVFSVRQRLLSVRPGYHMIIRVTSTVNTISEDVRGMDVSGRKCRLPHENEGMALLHDYTEKGCQLECQLRNAASFCRCIPWNYPNPIGGVSVTCDMFGAFCFEELMKDKTNATGCNCLPDCGDVKFSYNVQEVPIDVNKHCHKHGKMMSLLLWKMRVLYPAFAYNYMSLAKNISFSGYPKYVSKIKERMCRMETKKATALVTVLLDSDVYTLITKSRKSSFGGIVGTIGGTLGLFTGMSIISMVEITYWVVKSLAIWCSGHGSKKKRSGTAKDVINI